MLMDLNFKRILAVFLSVLLANAKSVAELAEAVCDVDIMISSEAPLTLALN